ncbi:beta-propeller domain-containing protein [Clostridium estertheticum]|uniref:beta-propeller domain-containing protein n=1 Tax=Clostridium estertheticum TaxID=238834 RepID=UPI0013E94D51|nr:beta-propeller domain-containing protein [Clostridium estertheticum]MBZ9688648.1 beta-propeller domain-containing protein [Clostridium estertheticum]
MQKPNDARVKANETQSAINTKDVAMIARPFLWKNTVRVIVYDIRDINNIKQIRKVEVDGNAMATRKIGDMLYLVSNDYLNYYSENIAKITPSYVDTAVGDGYINIDYADIHYLKNSIKSSYMILTAMNLENVKTPATIYTCLGGGGNIYMSKENLYISAEDNNRYINNTLMPEKVAAVDKTNIYKFQLKDGKFEFMAKGQVNGTVLNQFSMDENNNYFRIATTTNSAWNANGEVGSKNNVYILDAELKLKGKLEDMAIGEKIYSVRFMGDKGYVVTYKNIDPLFVIDLKDASNPSILGQLKIPGYSSYLQPYDENHIIGIGKDTQEVDGRVTESGVKLSLFDVADYKNPKEKFSTVIGDAGTSSEAIYNHKALLFSKDMNILAFPISVMINGGNVENKGIYSKQVFQGAYVYNIDLVNGFKLRGTITHLLPTDVNIDGYVSGYDRNIQRILFIDEMLYTISNDVIMANDFNDLFFKNKIIIGK